MAIDPLSRVFSALADPTRRDIVARLAAGDATVNELAEPYDVTLQAVSQHLKVLEGSGLVTRTRDAQRRPVHLEAEVFDLMTKWSIGREFLVGIPPLFLDSGQTGCPSRLQACGPRSLSNKPSNRRVQNGGAARERHSSSPSSSVCCCLRSSATQSFQRLSSSRPRAGL